MEKHLPYFQSDFVHNFIDVCQRLQHEKHKGKSVGFPFLLCYAPAVAISTFSCILLHKKKSGTLFYRWRNRHGATQRPFRSHNSSKREGTALHVPLSPRQAGCPLQFSALPGACSQQERPWNAVVTVTSSGQCRALTSPGQDPPAELRHPAHGWRRPGCCWSCSRGFAGKN